MYSTMYAYEYITNICLCMLIYISKMNDSNATKTKGRNTGLFLYSNVLTLLMK